MPKVLFKKMDLKKNIDIVNWCYKDDDYLLNVSEYTKQLFPELKEIDNGYSDDSIDSFIEKIVTDRYLKSEELLSRNAFQYEKAWNK